MYTDIYYTLPGIYGIQLIANGKILFEQKCPIELNLQQARDFYSGLDSEIKENIKCKIYVKYKSMDNQYVDFIWWESPIDKIIKN